MSTIDGSEIQAVTIDGEEVQEITMDGDVVWEARNVLDDYESYTSDSDLRATYTDPVGLVELETASPIEGGQSLTNPDNRIINAASYSGSMMDKTFSGVIRPANADNHPALMLFIQNLADSTSTQQDNSYAFHVQDGDSFPGEGVIVRGWQNGSIEVDEHFSASISYTNEYRIEVDTNTDHVFDVRLYDHSSDSLVTSGSVDLGSIGYTGGGIGWYSGREGGAVCDLLVEE